MAGSGHGQTPGGRRSKVGKTGAATRAATYAYSDPLKPDHAPSAVTTSGVTTPFTYDPNGNMLSGLGAKIMEYDGENRPLSVTYLGKKTCYVYGTDGKRLKKVEGLAPATLCTALPPAANVTTYFGPVEVRNWLGAEQVLTYPQPSVKLTNGVATWLHFDHLGSVRAITDATGAKVESAIYRPFGEQSEWLQPSNPAPETKGWIGERFDADAGLQYLNARYYDPALGLFLQPDWFEVTRPGVGTNRFSYSFNDPVNKIDPGGNCLEDFCIVEAILGVLAIDAMLDATNSTVVGDSPLGNPVGRASVAIGEAVAPHAGTLENMAMTTPTAADDVAAAVVGTWAKSSAALGRASRVSPAMADELAKSEATAKSVTEKLERYLLDPNHPSGGSKAKFFEQELGSGPINSLAGSTTH